MKRKREKLAVKDSSSSEILESAMALSRRVFRVRFVDGGIEEQRHHAKAGAADMSRRHKKEAKQKQTGKK